MTDQSAGRILVINPNSNPQVTEGMSEAVQPLRLAGGPIIDCVTLASGPFGIESQADVDQVAVLLREVVLRETADAFVIGCFSDPGLAACREASTKPILGIRECAVFAAMAQGDQFGVIALGPSSILRQARAFREMGVQSRCAGSEPLHLSVAEAEAAEAYPRVEAAGRALAERGAETLILGCAGMVHHRAKLEDAIGLPVIDPTQAATAQALGLVLLAART